MMTALAGLACLIWLVLTLFRGGFWRCAENDFRMPPTPTHWPEVVAVIPARDEADVIAQSIGSLLRQDYPGRFNIVLVDDQSSDGTADTARAAAASLGRADALTVLAGTPLPPGWAGKLWAVSQGLAQARAQFSPDYILLTDADIAHAPDNLRSLVCRATQGRYKLVSLMALLRCESLAEKALIPAFVYFFQMLYPFRWVNDPRAKTAGAAGGCMLAQTDALMAIGGVAAIKGALIDDCALGAKMKTQGPIWLGLTNRVLSLRPYPHFDDIRKMVSRSAYAQLHYQPLMLIGALLGMALVYFVPLLAALFGSGLTCWLGLIAYALMSLTFWPIQRFYHRSLLWAFALPAIAALYMAYTLDSALQYRNGRGGLWKGRAQAHHVRGAQ